MKVTTMKRPVTSKTKKKIHFNPQTKEETRESFQNTPNRTYNTIKTIEPNKSSF